MTLLDWAITMCLSLLLAFASFHVGEKRGRNLAYKICGDAAVREAK